MPLQCIVFSGLICSQHAIEMDLVSPKVPKNPDSNDSSPISISLKTKKLFKFCLLPTQPEQTISGVTSHTLLNKSTESACSVQFYCNHESGWK